MRLSRIKKALLAQWGVRTGKQKKGHGTLERRKRRWNSGGETTWVAKGPAGRAFLGMVSFKKKKGGKSAASRGGGHEKVPKK